MVKSLCTDLATLHAAIVADVTIALIKFLQDAQEMNDDGSVAVATDTIMHLHNRYMAILNDNGDPYHESAESELLAELPILAGLKAKRPAEDSEEDEDDSEDDSEKVETEASKVDSNFSELNLGKAGTEEYNIDIQRNLTPPLKVICHYPPVFVPCSSLPKISGSEAITVIQRDDNKRKLMTIGTWYLEGFVESEVDFDKNLGDTVILWYARTIVSGIAGAGHLAKCDGHDCSILIMGLGAGSIPSFLRSHYSHIRSIDVVEWSAAVLRGAKEGFGYADDDVIQTHISEAVEWTSQRAKRIKKLTLNESVGDLKYNVIVVDIYTENGMPPGLKDPLFFKRLKMLLRHDSGDKQSLVLINAGNEMEDFDGLIEMLERKFQHVHQFEHPDEENVIIMCSTANIMKNDGQDWRTSMSRDIPEEAFRMYLSRTNEEHNSTFISWMDDQSLCARDSRAVNTPQLHLMSKNIYSPTRYDTSSNTSGMKTKK